MTILSDRVKSLQPSPTLALSSKAKALKAAGEDVINLTAGEPDFDTPDYAKAGAQLAIEQGRTKYTPVDGMPELKAAVIAKFQKDNDLSYSPEQVVIGVGAKQLLFNCFLATLNDGDEVIVPAPYWVSYPSMVMIAGGKTIVVDCPETQGFKLTAEQLQQAITPKTKWLVLNSPNNPTGAVYSKEELSALADVLSANPHVYVISDDIYEHLTYAPAQFSTLGQVAPTLVDRIVTINGVSKAYAMTGWRIGYAGGPKDILRAMAKIQGQSTSNPCSIAQSAAMAALQGPKEDLARMNEIFDARRKMFVEGLNGIDGISVIQPDGAFYVFVNAQELIEKLSLPNDVALSEYLLDQLKIATVPGSAFGLAGYFRASYACSEEDLTRVIERLGNI